MTLASGFVLWIGLQELIAGILYYRQGNYGLAVGWMSYAVACVGFAWAGRS